MNETSPSSLSCPLPIDRYPTVTLAHGGGGKLMNDLIERVFIPAYGDSHLANRHDSAVVELGRERLAFTTDSFVVTPLFFPGGDVGSLSVYGTVNDLAMCGARPLYLSAGFILEEGLPMDTLWRVVQSMKQAADSVGVSIVTGDTKVVDRGKCDSLYINTSGVGAFVGKHPLTPDNIKEGDSVILSGDLGRHGIAVMAEREGLAFETTIESDLASLSGLVCALLDAGVEIHCMRDLTRGGLLSALCEISKGTGLSIHIRERDVPLAEEVRGACEILGLDPLAVANEGRFVAFLPEGEVDRTFEILRADPLGGGAVCIGNVRTNERPEVSMETVIGVSRILMMPSGEQLPRIC